MPEDIIETKERPKSVILSPFGLNPDSKFFIALNEKIDAMGTPKGIAEMFKESGVSFEIIGETAKWDEQGKGALFLGEHKTGIERLPILAVFGELGRNDIRFIAMPNTPIAPFIEDLDRKHIGYTLPVVPTALTQDGKLKMDVFSLLRLFNKSKLPTKEDAKKINNKSLESAATYLQDGYIVNIFPAGDITANITAPWKSGVGVIASQIPYEQRDNITVVPYKFDTDLTYKMVAGMVMSKQYGWKQKSEKVILRVGEQLSVKDIIGNITDPKEITMLLQNYSQNSFNTN